MKTEIQTRIDAKQKELEELQRQHNNIVAQNTNRAVGIQGAIDELKNLLATLPDDPAPASTTDSPPSPS